MVNFVCFDGDHGYMWKPDRHLDSTLASTDENSDKLFHRYVYIPIDMPLTTNRFVNTKPISNTIRNNIILIDRASFCMLEMCIDEFVQKFQNMSALTCTLMLTYTYYMFFVESRYQEMSSNIDSYRKKHKKAFVFHFQKLIIHVRYLFA